MTRRDFVGVSFGGPRPKGRGAARLARYVGDREGARTFGDRQAFLGAAKERAREGRRASYAHVVVSPERGEAFTDRDLERLIQPFTRDRNGDGCAYYGAVHRDTGRPHVHVAVARDRFEKRELERLKKEARALISSRERVRAPPWREGIKDREPPEREQRYEHERHHEKAPQAQHDLER